MSTTPASTSSISSVEKTVEMTARSVPASSCSADTDPHGARPARRVWIGGFGAGDGADREGAARPAGEAVARREAPAGPGAGAVEVAPAAALARLQRHDLAQAGRRCGQQAPAHADRPAGAHPARPDP